MPRQGLTRTGILEKAISMINRQGYEVFSLAALAKQLNVKPPALFKHYASIDALRESLTLHGLQLLKNHLQEAVTARTGDNALTALCHAYRNFARANSGLYRAIQPAYFRTNREVENAAMQLMSIIISVLKSFNVRQENYIHLLRIIRSSLHGFVVLEIEYGFGVTANIEHSFEQQIHALKLVINDLKEA